ncbi:MAG: amino acid racemase [Alphaproteobacteria bacterium]|nr:amino acid racemase [Alphaproteobacteria bacterium]
MKTIGLLGGTGWSSTIEYYRLLNELVAERLGGYHSAKILLKSIDYHDIMVNYGVNHDDVAKVLEKELQELIVLKPDCIVICCNSLHKYYDMIKLNLASDIPVMHAIQLVADHLKTKKQKKVLLLATKFTMEDGFFSKILEDNGIQVEIPTAHEQDKMQKIHVELMHNVVTQESRDYFSNLITKYKNLDAVVLGCTEYPLVVNNENSILPVVDPITLQSISAVNYALGLD